MNLLTSLLGTTRLTVKGEKTTKIELWLLQQLDLTDVDVLEREDELGGLFDFTANNLWNELGGKLSQGDVGGFTDHDLAHLLSDLTDLGGLGVGGLLDLVWHTLGEGNGEESEDVVIGSLDGDVGLDQSLPLSDERTELVRGEVQAVEVGQKVLALDLVNTELDLTEGVVLLSLEVGQRNVENTALELVVGVLQTSRTVDKGLANITVLKGGWGLDVVPVLSGEWVDNLLLQTLLALTQSLVLTDNHLGAVVAAVVESFEL